MSLPLSSLPLTSHEIVLIEPLLITPASFGHEILISPLPPLLVLPPLPRNLFLLLLPLIILDSLLRPLLRQIRLLVGG